MRLTHMHADAGLDRVLNEVAFSLGHALELEEKLRARERGK